jgi:hypothetical protein
MANERLRAAIAEAGLDADQLATLVEVDVKTVRRWISEGRTPYGRHRARVARELGREQRDLWPDAAVESPPHDPRHEIVAAFAHANDLRAPDWRAMLRDATEQIDLLDSSLIEIVSAAGVTDLLAAKAAAGCSVRILIAGIDSLWVTSTARQLGQDDDYLGRNDLQREVELARGHLEPLIELPGIEIHAFYAEQFNSILRVDDQMLVTLHLWATTSAQAPLLHLRRAGDDGLFAQFARHVEAIHHQASQPVQPNPEYFPNPLQDPDRYRPVTDELAEHRLRELQEQGRRKTAAAEPRHPRPEQESSA